MRSYSVEPEALNSIRLVNRIFKVISIKLERAGYEAQDIIFEGGGM